MTRDRRTDLLICLALVAMVAAVYWPVARFGFVAFDDDVYVYANPALSAGLSPAGLRWAFTTFYAANYHPLIWVSFLFDRTVWGLRPAPMHVENLALHAASAALLFGFLKRATGNRWPAAFVAAVFAVHPAHVESVAWVTERKDTLSLFLLFLSAHAYLDHIAGRRWAYLRLLVLYAASLLSKSTGVTWPALLLLLDVWPLGRLRRSADEPTRWRPVALEKLPLVALAIAGSAMTAMAQRAGGTVSRIDMVPPGARLGNGIVAYARYLAETVWPSNLAAFYRFRWPIPASTIAGSILAMLILTVAAVRLGRRRPYVVVGWLWFVGTMVPMLGLVQVGSQSMADRYLYLPMIGLTIVAAWAAAEPPWHRVVGGVGIAALIALGVAARRQTWVWSDTMTLQRGMMNVEGGEAAVNEWLGMKAVAAADVAGAEQHLSEVMRLDPSAYTAAFNLGNLRLRTEHRPDGAIECYRLAAVARPDLASVQANWGVALLQLGRPAEAYEHLRAAEQIDPDAFDPHFNLGLMFLSAGRREAAAAEFAAAVRADPASAVARAKLAEATR